MMVYLAYTLIILHVLLGIIQYETSPVFVSLLAIGFIAVATLHFIAGRKETQGDKEVLTNALNDFQLICRVEDIPEKRAKVVSLGNDRIAIFKYDNKVSAVSNVCKHQNGPLGEGRIIDGCITCPWHGYQYLPHNGSSPPPFKEMVATYDIRVLDGEVWLNATPYPDGTERPPATF